MAKKETKEPVENKKQRQEDLKKRKQNLKKAKKIEKEAMLNEKKKLDKEIKDLSKEKKSVKSKVEKKEINQKIKNVKHQRNKIGKRDSYLSDVLEEMKLVRWPKKEEVIKYSIASFIFVAIFALFFFGIDALFALVKDLMD